MTDPQRWEIVPYDGAFAIRSTATGELFRSHVAHQIAKFRTRRYAWLAIKRGECDHYKPPDKPSG